MTPPTVIVGAGLGALRTAESLRKNGHQGPITVIGEEQHFPYNRPPLSKEALAGGVKVTDLHFPRKPVIDDVTWRLGVRAISSDLAGGTIGLDDGSTIEAGSVVIASGIRPRQLPIPGPQAGRVILRTADDALSLREQLQPGRRIVILGAGFIGCEVAATARKLGVEVDVVALDSEPMVRPLGSELGAAMREHHEENGVRFHLGRTVDHFDGDHHITAAVLDDGTRIEADIVLEAIGSIPNSEWLEGNELDLSDGVLTDEFLSVVGSPIPAVAVGDISRHPNALFPGRILRIEHWNMPTETGKRAGQTLAQLLLGEQPTGAPFRALPSFWSDQYSLTLQSFGLPGVATERRLVDGDYRSDCIVEYHDESGLVGVVGVNRTAELVPYRKALLARVP